MLVLLAVGLKERWNVNMVKAGTKPRFHDTCPRSADECGTWSPAVSFVLADENENLLFLIWLKLKRWWVSRIRDSCFCCFETKRRLFLCNVQLEKGSRISVADPQNTMAVSYTIINVHFDLPSRGLQAPHFYRGAPSSCFPRCLGCP